MTTEQDTWRQALWAWGEKLTQTGLWEHDLASGELSMGHARALITAPDPEGLAEEVVGHQLFGFVSKAGPLPRQDKLYAMDMPHIETLEQAKHFIDTLALLEEKTAGHRTPEESALLSEMLHQLRLGYVMAQAKPSTGPAGAS